MRKAGLATLFGFLTTLVLTSSAALAIQIDVSLDKHVVGPGGAITVEGTITDDDGNTGVFDYRVAAVAPGRSDGGERIVICDSGRQTTGSDGAVSFECDIPTLEELEALGVRGAADRSVIPIKGGIIAVDSELNFAKKSGKAFIVNTDKLNEKFQNALDRLDDFIAHAQEAIAKCDNVIARAEEAGADDLIDRCINFQSKMQEHIDSALAAQERIRNAMSNITDYDIDDLRNAFGKFEDRARDFRTDVRDHMENLMERRGELERRVTDEIVNRTRERAEDLREKIREEQAVLKDRAENIKEVAMDIRNKRVTNVTAVHIEGESGDDVEDDNSGSGSDSSGSEEE